MHCYMAKLAKLQIAKWKVERVPGMWLDNRYIRKATSHVCYFVSTERASTLSVLRQLHQWTDRSPSQRWQISTDKHQCCPETHCHRFDDPHLNACSHRWCSSLARSSVKAQLSTNNVSEVATIFLSQSRQKPTWAVFHRKPPAHRIRLRARTSSLRNVRLFQTNFHLPYSRADEVCCGLAELGRV